MIRRRNLATAVLFACAPLAVGLMVLAVYALTRAPSFSWTAGVSDSAELAAAAYVLGVPHPTGYPLYMLLGWPISHLALLGQPAQALTWLSIVCGALAALLAGMAARSLDGGDHIARRVPQMVAILVGGLGCATLPSLWLQATAPETRSLALALVLGVVAAMVSFATGRLYSMLVLAWLLFGLALADHLFCLAVLPALLLLTLGVPDPCSLRGRLEAIAAIIPGVSLYLYLPIRAAAHPVLNWGDPQSPSQFLWEVTGAQYRSLMGTTQVHLGDRLVTVWQVAGPVYTVLGVAGLALLIARRPLLGSAMASICITSVAISALYSAVAAPVYLLPCEAVLCVAAGYLAAQLLQGAGHTAFTAGTLATLLTLAIAPQCVADLHQARGFYRGAGTVLAATYGRLALSHLPRGALLLTTGDYHTFTLWYAQDALGERPDVVLVSTDLLAWHWYRDDLQRRYPWLHWGPRWGPDTGNPVSRARARGIALAAAMAGRRPLFWTDPFTVPIGRCGLVVYQNLFRCVPIAG